MAVTPRRELAPLPVLRWPDPTAFDPDVVRIHYSDDLDTLYVFFVGHAVPAVECPLVTNGHNTAYATVRLTEDHALTGEVVGVMIESFARFGVRERPSWAAIAEFAGLPRAIPDPSPASSKERRGEAIRALVADMATLPPDEGIDFDAAADGRPREASQSA